MSVFSSLWVPKSVNDAAEEIGADLADGDEVLVYDLSAAADKKSLLSRVWTYISSKLSSYTGALSANQFSLAGNITTTAWTTAGVRHKNAAATLTDTSSSGTVEAAYSNVFGGNTIAASNVTVFTKYSTFYLAEPSAGANVSFINKYALLTPGTIGAGVLEVSGSDEPTYGAELLTTAGWTANAGWTESPDDAFSHTSGTDTLTHSAAIANATKYQLAYTITGRTAGTITITVGGATTGAVAATGTFGPTTSSAAALTVTPTTDFNGTCIFSLKAITAVSTPRLVAKNATGTTVLETRTRDAANMFVGVNAGQYCTTGSNNVGMGYQAQRSLTTGSSNVGMGYQAQYSLTTGSNNVGMGYQAQRSLTTGSSNVGMGYHAQHSLTTGTNNAGMGYQAQRGLTTGTYNVGMGYQAQYSLTTGSNNVGMGYQAGRYHADGATALTDPEFSVYIGTNARGKDNSDENSVVIGGNTPIGLGANTTVIGTSATTLTRLFGDITTGTDTASAAMHAVKTAEQLRLGYDASNYLSITVDAAGDALLKTSSNKIRLSDTTRTPASASASGKAGELCWDAAYLYVCVAANTWKRAALSTW